MKQHKKGPKEKINPGDKKENGFKGHKDKVSGKSPEPGSKSHEKNAPQAPEANSENWEYPAESSHRNQHRDISNQHAGIYKQDHLSKGPDNDDDDDDYDNAGGQGHFDDEDEEF